MDIKGILNPLRLKRNKPGQTSRRPLGSDLQAAPTILPSEGFRQQQALPGVPPALANSGLDEQPNGFVSVYHPKGAFKRKNLIKN
jgi:hypothetical protein